MKTKNYKVVNGISFDVTTNETICNILANAHYSGQKLKIYFGDTKTGRDWNEENDTTGKIGRSTGTNKVPLLLTNYNSTGGSHLLDHCIVKIVDFKTKTVLYQHPKYIAPVIDIIPSDLPEYKFYTIVNGALYGRHKSLKSAQICKSKIQ
jgi:hypothetical protein